MRNSSSLGEHFEVMGLIIWKKVVWYPNSLNVSLERSIDSIEFFLIFFLLIIHN